LHKNLVGGLLFLVNKFGRDREDIFVYMCIYIRQTGAALACAHTLRCACTLGLAVRARACALALPMSQVGSRSIWFAHAKEAFEKGGIPPPSSPRLHLPYQGRQNDCCPLPNKFRLSKKNVLSFALFGLFEGFDDVIDACCSFLFG